MNFCALEMRKIKIAKKAVFWLMAKTNFNLPYLYVIERD